jgi:hypothetical protein
MLTDRIREIVKAKLKETSATSQGGASFTPGAGEQYATPKAFNKNKNAEKRERKQPNTTTN